MFLLFKTRLARHLSGVLIGFRVRGRAAVIKASRLSLHEVGGVVRVAQR